MATEPSSAVREAERVAKIVEQVTAFEEMRDQPPGELMLSTGVVLKIRAVAKSFIYQVTQSIEPPEVPVVWVAEKETNIENPDDPDYTEKLETWAVEIANASTDVALLRGTTIVKIPDGFMGPDDEEWVDEMKLLGLPMIDNQRARYLAWVKAIAAPVGPRHTHPVGGNWTAYRRVRR